MSHLKKRFFVAATGQNVGKTTICLGLVSGLLKRHASVGFIKPVGQEHVEIAEGVRVDKDVALFQSHFHLQDKPEEMSPVLFPKGFTRDYLDGKISHEHLKTKITTSFDAISERHHITVIEGTGHTGVGSIVDLNNAQVASLLKAPVLLIASGGLGSSFDLLALNYVQCQKEKVPVLGVILNRVLSDKREMILDYMKKALKKWDIPLLGALPFDALLSTPTMSDFQELFHVDLISGEKEQVSYFHQIRLITSINELFRSPPKMGQLIITAATSEDVILATLTKYWDQKITHKETPLEIGFILTGKEPPSSEILEQIQSTKIPAIYVPISSFLALKMIHTHTTKISEKTQKKIDEAVKVVKENVHFDALEQRIEEIGSQG